MNGIFTGCFATLVLASGCFSSRVEFQPGTDCELNTDCGSALVCRLGRCRRECRAHRDCPVGLDCVRDEGGFGACQLPEETSCALSSECPAPLVCRNGSCTNACETDRDCPAGSRCREDSMGGRGCDDVAMTECSLNSDCVAPLICAVDGLCREQCRTDRDCRDGTRCDATFDPAGAVCRVIDSVDAGMDAALPSDASVDAPTDVPIDVPTDGGLDAPMDTGVDAPLLDAGFDAGIDGGIAMTSMLGAFRLTSGTLHTCAAPTPTTTYCWGSNTYGQLGDGMTANRSAPYPLALPGQALQVQGGADHTCAQTSMGFYCWGRNADGQLGVGTMTAVERAPMLVIGVTAVDIGAGESHTCVLETGRVRCWGANAAGQVGDGTTTPRSTPTMVSGLRAAPMLQLATDGRHNCVLFVDGTVQCWGSNSQGQLGVGVTGGTRATPVDVMNVTDGVEIIAGSNHACVRRIGGQVQCWGDNFSGQLGDGSRTVRSVPVSVMSLSGVVQLTAGFDHTCALRDDGAVWCWGSNIHQQLARPVSTIESTVPVTIAGLPLIEEVAAGERHNCARGVDGATHHCWGDNVAGQLGNGSMMDSMSPVGVTFP